MYHVVVLGATGASGRHVVGELLLRNDVNVTTIGRRSVQLLPEYNLNAEKLQSDGRIKSIVDVDFENLETYKGVFDNKIDAVLCCLGTTRADAGSAKEFIRIDQGYVMKFAQELKARVPSLPCFGYISSMNANASSWFLYPRTKGETENMLGELKFPVCHIYQPGFLGRGDKQRSVEKLAMPLKFLFPFIECRDVAKCIVSKTIETLKQTPSNTAVFERFSNKDMVNVAKDYHN
eukprot:GDKJ01014828.1.p1 GENE.GDKJ01014828.1~~GDKJ01014828.1.p1  ORF type:complete len:234 (+),score=43.85 GDKJ01014828.1:25-726(+)